MAIALLCFVAGAQGQGDANLVVVSSRLPPGVAGMPYRGVLQASGGKAPYAWKLDAGSTLPPGLQLDPSTGVVSGVPAQGRSIFVSATVTDSTSPTPLTANAFISIPISEQLHFTAATMRDAIATLAYLDPLPVDGGVPPYTFQLVSGALPDGVALPQNAVTDLRQLQGNPTKVGAFTFTLAVRDAETPPATAQQAISIRVDPRLIFEPALPIPGATVGQAYSYRFQASGGVSPLHWSFLASAAPTGLSLDPDSGILAGTPTQAFDGEFTVQVADSAGQPQFQIAQIRFQVDGKRSASISIQPERAALHREALLPADSQRN